VHEFIELSVGDFRLVLYVVQIVMVVQGCPELVYAVWHDAVWLSAEFEFTGKNNRVARNEQVSHADFFERARSEVGRQIPISSPKRENIRIASCRLSIKTAIRWVTQKSGETHRIAVGKELSGTRQAGPPSR